MPPGAGAIGTRHSRPRVFDSPDENQYYKNSWDAFETTRTSIMRYEFQDIEKKWQ